MTDENAMLDEQDATGKDAVDTAEEDTLDEEKSLQDRLRDVLKVQIEDIGPLRKQVTITIPRESIDEQLSEQFDELRQEANVPGFRRGRAPMRLIEKRFGQEVGDQVSTSLIGSSYLAAIEREKLDVLGDPLVRVKVSEKRRSPDGDKTEVEVEKLLGVDEALKHLRLPREGDLSYVCEVEVKPVFDLPKLDKIPVQKPAVTISDQDVEDEIRRRMSMRGSFKPVEDGKIQTDDLLTGKARLIVDGAAIHTEESAELAARDQNYEGVPLIGFGTAAVGCKNADTISLDVEIPDDHTIVSARGREARFELTVTQVRRLEIPELDQEFLVSLGFDSRDDFHDLIRDQMERSVAHEIQRLMFSQIERYLLDNTKLEVPTGISQRHVDRIVARRMMELYSRGVSEAEISKQADELRTQASAQAAEEIRYLFIMSKIADEHEIKVTEEEINAAIAEIAHRRNRRFDRVRDEIIGTNHLTTLYTRLRDEKILDRLLADAEVTEKTAAEKEPAKASTRKKSTRKKSAKKQADSQDADE